MKHEVPYAVLLERHPEAVAEALRELRRSRSKFRNDPPETLKWYYTWGIEIPHGPHPWGKAAFEDRLKETLSRVHSSVAVFTKGMAYHGSLTEQPPAIVEFYREILEDVDKRDER